MSRNKIFLCPGQVPDSGGRSMGISVRSDGYQYKVLLEWRPSAPASVGVRVAKALENIPTDQDINRAEEIRTLKFEGLFYVNKCPIPALVYNSSQKHLDLREAFLMVEKPSLDDRRIIGSMLTNKIRSLNVHFNLVHTGLRAESFIFFSDSQKTDMTNPYVLDWTRPSVPSIYEHPDFLPGRQLWYYDVWSLMMILSEVAEWKLVDRTFRDADDLLRKKVQRIEEVMDRKWKGDQIAIIMQFGFRFLEQDRSVLDNLSRKDIKRFFDDLCSRFEKS